MYSKIGLAIPPRTRDTALLDSFVFTRDQFVRVQVRFWMELVAGRQPWWPPLRYHAVFEKKGEQKLIKKGDKK